MATKKKAPRKAKKKVEKEVEKDYRFVNRQPTSTMVPGPDGRRVTVASWHKRHNNVSNATVFVVEGEHYEQFCSGKGPLYPFPAGQDDPRVGAPKASVPKPPVDTDETDDAAGDGGDPDAGGESGDPDASTDGAAGDGDSSDGNDASSGDDGAGTEAETEEKASGGGLKKKLGKKAKKKS